MASDSLRGPWLKCQLHPARVQVFARLRSTNEFAAAQIETGKLNAPALIAASRQTAGRGQHANRWWSDAGSVCATFVLPADVEIPIGQIPLRAGLAVALVVARFLPSESVQVKWPNDVFVNGSKIAGLLCARVRDADMIGIGINVRTDLRQAPRDVRKRATSLSRYMRNPPRRDELLRDVWFALRETRQNGSWFMAFENMHLLHNRHVRVATDDGVITGMCRGIDRQGRLLVEDKRSIQQLTNGIITSIR